MNYQLFLSELLYTLKDFTYIMYNTKMPTYGYLFISNAVLIFLFEIKNIYKIKRLEKRLKELQ